MFGIYVLSFMLFYWIFQPWCLQKCFIVGALNLGVKKGQNFRFVMFLCKLFDEYSNIGVKYHLLIHIS